MAADSISLLHLHMLCLVVYHNGELTPFLLYYISPKRIVSVVLRQWVKIMHARTHTHAYAVRHKI